MNNAYLNDISTSHTQAKMRRLAQIAFLNLFFLTSIATLSLTNASAGFRASVVKVDITPAGSKWLVGYAPRQSTGVNDRLFHRIVALDDGTTQFFLVQSDLCVISPSEYDRVAALLQVRLGIKPVHFWWSLSHTHSAPEVGVPGLPEVFMGERYKHEVDTAYTSLVEQALINGIAEAKKRLVPARFGVNWGFSQANINRRAIGEDGRASLGMNPDGAVDRRIGLLRIDKADGGPLALVANYPIHGTVLGEQNLQISGDAPGIVSEYVEQKTGVPLLFINGAAGNLAPIYSVYSSPASGHLDQFKVLLGDRILQANERLKMTTDSVKMFSSAVVIETPRKPGLSWSNDLAAYTKTSEAGIKIVMLPIRFLRLNADVAIWSAPLELFCEVANEVRENSPFPYTFYFGYTNGWLGYLPTAEEWKHGGYEIDDVSPYTPGAAKEVTQTVIHYLEEEMRRLP